MKALIYCRVSSQRQVDEGHGLDSQEQRCRSFANQKKYAVEAVFRDEGISGAVFERKGISELFDHIATHAFEKYVVIVDDLSRIARDIKVHGLIREQLKKMEADLLSPNFQFDDTPEGELGENLIASINQYNRKANRRQVIQKMKARAESGYWPFCPPPGLVSKKDPIHGKLLTPDEPLASIIKSAIKGYRDRLLMTQLDIVDFLNKEYATKGLNRKVSLHGVQEILNELLYAGYLEYPKWGVSRRKAAHEGFISIETYEEVQKILHDRTKPKSRRDTNPEFPLRNLTLCSNCHKPHTASFHHGHKGQLYPHYFCKTSGCPLKDKSIHRDKIEDDFLSLLTKLPLPKNVEGLATDILIDVWEQHQAQYDEARIMHQKSLQELTDSIGSLTGLVSRATNETLIRTYEVELTKLGKKKEDLESMTFTTHYTTEQFGTASKKVIETLENPVGMWQTKKLEDQLTVFFMHFDQKPVYDKEMGFGTPILAQSVELIRSLGSEKISSVEMPGNGPGSESET